MMGHKTGPNPNDAQFAEAVSHLKKVAPRARFELATVRLTADEVKNLSALSGVAYDLIGAILMCT
jgi:hypothetical protein